MSSTTAAKTNPEASTKTMNIKVYNSLTRTKETFETVEPGKVGIYLCGPTVYDKAHIGHMVGPVIFDTIKRHLQFSGYDVTWVVNITDVDDKLITKANERKITMSQVAEENTEDYYQNLAALGVETIDHFPKATDNMDNIISFIESLIEKDFSYESQGDVYFDVAKDPQYGKLTNRSIDDSQGEGGETADRKRNVGDFALWKSAKPDEPSWDSPWGKGRPGWHIECSAMSRALLGETFDIHGGGLDLIFPHHENELAQSECCHSKPMAKYWMHNGLLRAGVAGKVGGRGDRDAADDAEATPAQATAKKMSRSAGAGGLADLIEQQGGERIRFFLLRTHYRSTVVFSGEAVEEAGTGLEAFYRFFERYQRVTGESFYDIAANESRAESDITPDDDSLLKLVHERCTAFLEKMDDDFNTGAAVSELFELVRALNKFVDDEKLEETKDAAKIKPFKQGVHAMKLLCGTLGLFHKKVEQQSGADDQLVGELMNLVLKIRDSARANKDWGTSDMIRDGLTELGITIEDRKGGSDWRLDR